jgi:hypothetical protein
MTKRHSQRDDAGRFTPAVPVPDTSLTDLSGDPQGENGRPADATVYPPHDYRYGPVQRLLPHRRQRVINARTGEELSSHITDVRAIQARPHGRTAIHVVETDGVPFLDAAPPKDAAPGYRAVPYTGRRLPSKGQTDNAPFATDTGVDNPSGLFR